MVTISGNIYTRCNTYHHIHTIASFTDFTTFVCTHLQHVLSIGYLPSKRLLWDYTACGKIS